MKSPDNLAMRIGAWRVDPTLDEISKDGTSVKLEPRTMQLLVCLAEHAGQVLSVEQLLDQVWKDVVVTPNSLYHAVAELRRVLGDDPKEPSYIANVLRRGYRLVAPVAPWVDAPAVLAADSPASSLTATKASPAAATTRSPLRALGISLIVALVVMLVLSYFAADRLWLSKRNRSVEYTRTAVTSVASDKSIAVLPFVDMSEKKDQQYFADGMAEEVLDLLTKVPGLRVIGRTSSFQFKGKSEDLRTIGTKLGAAYVLEGSVRRSGDRLRVTAKLFGTEDGSHVWSESYDEDFGDALKIQDRIAVGLVRALQVTVGANLPSRPVLKSAVGYDLYQRGRHALDRFDKIGFESAAGYFQQALQLDPTSIRAAEGLFAARDGLAEAGFVPAREGFEQARADAELVLKLDPGSGTGHAGLAYIHAVYDWDWPAAVQEIQQALTLSPRDPQIIEDAAVIRLAQGQLDEAERLYNEVFALDPLYAGLHWGLGIISYRTERLTLAEAEARKILEISPTYNGGHYFLGQMLLAEGRPDAALAEMQNETPEGGRYAGLAIVNYAMKRNAEADAALAQATKAYAANWPCAIAAIHAYRGEFDQAFVWVDRAYLRKDSSLSFVKVDPYLSILATDLRYKVLLRKMKLPE